MVLAYKRNLTVQTHRESLTLMCELKNEMKVKKRRNLLNGMKLRVRLKVGWPVRAFFLPVVAVVKKYLLLMSPFVNILSSSMDLLTVAIRQTRQIVIFASCDFNRQPAMTLV